MADSIRQPSLPTPLGVPDGRARMAKAGIPKAKNHAALGRRVARVLELSALSLKEFSALLGRNERQIGRWLDGSDRPQLELIYAVPALNSFLVIALAEGVATVDVTTTITVRRIA